MSAAVRQKACLGCASSKRKCDKQLPECQRCLDRDVDCMYPQPKRRRRDRIRHDFDATSFPLNVTSIDRTSNVTLPADIGATFEPWTSSIDSDVDLGLAKEVEATFATPPSPFRVNIARESDIILSKPRPWFLKEETWALQHSDPCKDCPLTIEYEPYIEAVREMLHCWTQHGHNNFIHPRLYADGLPTCLQDAFTTLTAYVHRTPAVKNTVLQIVDERAAFLTCLNLLPEPGEEGVRARLARVQALFIYVFVGLFDGSIHARVAAERQIATLRLWLTELWQAARDLAGEDLQPLSQSASADYYAASSAVWKLWILAESARRTLLIVETILNTYQAMTIGWVECPGCVMFTARRGLWEAASAVKWTEMCRERSPLLIASLQPERYLAQYGAEEIDDFVKLFWTYVAGPEKIQWWVDRSGSAARV